MRRRIGAISVLGCVGGLVWLSLAGVAVGQSSSTYIGPGGLTGTPVTGTWNAAANWSPAGVPVSNSATNLMFPYTSGTAAVTATNVCPSRNIRHFLGLNRWSKLPPGEGK